MADLIVDWPKYGSHASSVKFDLEKNTIHRYEVYIDGSQRRWYSRSELKALRQDHIENIRSLRSMIRNGNLALVAQSDDCCLHGVENIISASTARTILAARAALLCSVITEQSRQKRSNLSEPLLIAEASTSNSEWSRNRAHLIGLHHADAVKAQ